jgi:argininosuccinate lyase
VQDLWDQLLPSLDIESLRKLEQLPCGLAAVAGTTTNIEAASALDLQYEASHHNFLGSVIPIFHMNEVIRAAKSTAIKDYALTKNAIWSRTMKCLWSMKGALFFRSASGSSC